MKSKGKILIANILPWIPAFPLLLMILLWSSLALFWGGMALFFILFDK